jgi:hypothetical protein
VDTEIALAERIQRVGTVELRDANRPLQAGDAVYKAQCAACHDAGLAGAPKFGDAGAWGARIGTGYEALLTAAPAPEDIAIEQVEGGDYRWSDLDRGSAMLANLFNDLGLQPGERVALQVEKSVEALMVWLACLRAGLVLVPLNPAYAAVSLGLLHGSQPDVFVVCHDPTRTHMLGLDGYALPAIEEVIDMTIRLGRRTNPAIRCAGVSLNTVAMGAAAANALMAAEAARLGLPVADPILGGTAFEALVDACLA